MNVDDPRIAALAEAITHIVPGVSSVYAHAYAYFYSRSYARAGARAGALTADQREQIDAIHALLFG